MTIYEIINEETCLNLPVTKNITVGIFLVNGCIFYGIFIVSLCRVYNSLKISNKLKTDELYMALQFLMILAVFITAAMVLKGDQTAKEYFILNIGLTCANLLMAIIMSFTVFKKHTKIGITTKI